MASPVTRHLTILLTDIKGFTDKTSSKTRADIQGMLDEHRAVVLPILEGGGGHLIKTIGDAFLMTFESPTNAVLAGVAVQEALSRLNEGRSAQDRLEIRIAINSGEINLVDGDVFGEPVNITARIEGIAEAGQVYFTEAVYLSMNKAEVPSSEVGLMQLKGIPEKIRVYKVRREDPIGEVAAAPARSRFFGLIPPMPAAAPAFGPGVKAIPAPSASAALPPHRRRIFAVLIDALLCSLILGFFNGFGRAHPGKRPAETATVNAKGLVASEGGNKFTAGPDGLKASSEEDEDGGPLLGGILSGWGRYALVWAVYGLMFLKWMSGSPGKQLMGLRVVSDNGASLEKRQRMIRAFFSLVSAYAGFIGYLWAFWEPKRRTWHDLMAGTRVVSVE